MPLLDSFDDLFTRYAEPMQRVAYGIVRSHETSAELVQDVFLKLWSIRETVEVTGDIEQYLRRATRNRALDWMAREARHREWEEREHDPDDLPHGVPGTQEEEAPPDAAVHETIQTALDAMPVKRREVCRLRWLDGVGPLEISRRLHVSVKTVETQLRRGKIELANRLAHREHP
jgi:RNA polymerase sigma-70 factor (ECF subfamily)